MPSDPTSPTVPEMLGDCLTLICAVALYGPPVIFLAAPWLLLALLLSGPFALVLTLVVALLAATALLASIGAVLAMPYLFIRRKRVAAVPVAAAVAPRVPASPQLRRVAA